MNLLFLLVSHFWAESSDWQAEINGGFAVR